MAFSEVREYQFGDDIRSIDWNVTARFNAPYVKVFEEERELTVMLLVDVSGSKEFGTQKQLKQDLVTELSAVLAFSAIQNNDKIGMVFFSDIIEKFIPPKKGTSHILRIIRELINFKPQHKATNIAHVLRYFTNVINKRCIAFLITDFLNDGFEDALKIANKKHDMVAIRIYDNRETEMPPVGTIKLKDAETGKFMWINTNKTVRKNYNTWNEKREQQLKEIFIKSGVDSIALRTDQSYIKPLMGFFKRRGSL